jgi:hypothetical protein
MKLIEKMFTIMRKKTYNFFMEMDEANKSSGMLFKQLFEISLSKEYSIYL